MSTFSVLRGRQARRKKKKARSREKGCGNALFARERVSVSAAA